MKKKLLIWIPIVCLLMGCGSASKDAALKLTAGQTAFDAGDYAVALSNFKEAVELSPERDTYRALGILYIQTGKYPEAEQAFLDALASSGGFINDVDIDLNEYLAKAYYLNAEYSKADEVYTALLTVKPKITKWYYSRALCRLYLKQRTEAEEDFAKYTAADPGNVDKYIQIFYDMKNAGFDTDAVSYLTTVFNEREKSLSDYDKGRICYYLENYSDARVYLEKAKDMSKPDTILMLGKTYEAIADYNYAASLYNSYLSDKGNSAGVYNQLGVCRMKMGDYEAAKIAFASGLKLEDDEWKQELLFNEAIAYEYLHEYSTALTKFESYLFLYPQDEAAMHEYTFLKSR